MAHTSPTTQPRRVRPATPTALRRILAALTILVLTVVAVGPAIALSTAAPTAPLAAAAPISAADPSDRSLGAAGAPDPIAWMPPSDAPAASPADATAAVQAPAPHVQAPSPRKAAAVVPVAHARKTTSAATYTGANRVWIPSLGVTRPVYTFACSRSRSPDNYVYRWGCSGSNNVYLMGHAYGVFKPLHDAYYDGRLRNGMRVVYADGAGRVRTYAVIWWRVVRPTTDASWAWASLSTSSMTLQTCVGANSQYRLMVRLAQVG
jgi:sortase (surface protein transpeptidase)